MIETIYLITREGDHVIAEVKASELPNGELRVAVDLVEPDMLPTEARELAEALVKAADAVEPPAVKMPEDSPSQTNPQLPPWHPKNPYRVTCDTEEEA